MRQSVKHKLRNVPVRSKVKTLIKKELDYIRGGKIAEAQKFLSKVYSAIDTAAKKHVLEKNNASRKKSRLARALAKSQGEDKRGSPR